MTVIGLLVFGLIVPMIRHRRAKNPNPATFHEHAWESCGP